VRHSSRDFQANRRTAISDAGQTDPLYRLTLALLDRALDHPARREVPAGLADTPPDPALRRQLDAYLDLHARFGLEPLSSYTPGAADAARSRFADLVTTACAMDRDAAFGIAITLVRADMAPLAVSIAQQIGLHLMRALIPRGPLH